MELVDEFHEEAVIQSFHVTNTQSTIVPFLANTIPSNEAKFVDLDLPKRYII